MDGSTIMRNKFSGLERLVFMVDLYKERYCAKYLDWPVVRYL